MIGPLSKRVRHSSIPPNCAPDIHRGKAIAIASTGILVGGGLSALVIAVASLLIAFSLCVIYGIGLAIASV